MKVAITCDYLLNRSHYVEIVENLCEVFPEAVIYCFAHKKGAILGHIEQRSIRSTYLSNIVKTEEDFYKHSYKLPMLAKNLFVSCEYDLIINISKGFSQGFSKCKTTRLVSYLYDFDLDDKIKNSFVQKIFYPYISRWIKQTINNADKILLSREDLFHELLIEKERYEILPPPFRVSDYSLFPKDMFKHHFFLIEAKGVNEESAEKIIAWMKDWNYPFQFIGVDEHLAQMKKKYPENAFFGNRCSGEHAPVLAAARAFISFNTEDFPHLALATLATGRPVIIQSNLKKWISGTGIVQVETLEKNILKKAIEELPEEESLNGQKLRAHVMEYHDVKFKAKMKRVLDHYLHEFHSNSGQHPTDCSQCN